ncbi:myeloid-associated differentiation marker [Bombina bombina]|uniref:myeloid-associated differentiation marker n=1 Tax=Bombina bombina TaxID=8345 RepID=UPI00235A8811|nr:myeloid-associated differentiation marker [Bombina bombina]
MHNLDMDYRSMASPLGIVRFFQVFLSCTSFSLVASVHAFGNSYGSWSMFTWIFCFIVTILIIILELTGLCRRIPISWEDFTSAFSMLATLMLFTTSIMYPAVFLNGGCSGHSCACRGSATATSILCFFAYAIEVGLTRAKPGEISGFLATVPGLLKVFQSYVACVIFSILPINMYTTYPGLQWCVAVYSICFIITTLIIIFTIGGLLARSPVDFEKLLIAYNFLSVAMYITVAVIWPYYCFKDSSGRPTNCGNYCVWDNMLAITFLAYINLVAYIVDMVYSIKMVFFVVNT